ncbi:MAG: amidohydrolase [Saprospiraceae bacterium]|nr:amidohydrolase [Saprospiraceae bacterium]
MTRIAIILLFFFSLSANGQDQVINEIDQKSTFYGDIAHQIWEYAELGYLEEKSTSLLQKTLRDEGFSIEKGVADIPTAFEASFGSGSPVVGILAEFDALPGVSQAAVPERKEISTGGNGHACGHHLFGTGSSAAAIAVKNWMKDNGIQGTIKLFGTPAEEGGAGKVYMARAGLFDDVDVMLHWHPSSRNAAWAASSLANKSAKFRFYGQASHAAVAPHNGRSALDAVEAMNYMANMMREHVPSESRIHYVITSGGEAPNVVPAYAEVFYYVRHPEMQWVKDIFDRLVKVAEAAALGTETRMDYEVIHGVYNLLPNESISKIMHKNLEQVGGIHYTDEEVAFAKAIKETLPKNAKTDINSAQQVIPFQVLERGMGGSTDVGDVSWQVPTAGLSTATWVPGTSAHTWQAVAAGGTSIGTKGMINAAKVLALTAMDIFKDPSVCNQALEELNRRRGDGFRYEAMLGDREPPLDYRK